MIGVAKSGKRTTEILQLGISKLERDPETNRHSVRSTIHTFRCTAGGKDSNSVLDRSVKASRMLKMIDSRKSLEVCL